MSVRATLGRSRAGFQEEKGLLLERLGLDGVGSAPHAATRDPRCVIAEWKYGRMAGWQRL